MIRQFLAPAKINLCLHVLRKRTDGYHDLAMLMQRVGLYDRIEIELRETPGIEVRCDGVALAADEENIATRAARLLFDGRGYPGGARIGIDKRIPVAAGLGGGSSDAAAVLLGLNEWLRFGYSRPELMAMGRSLGADVPFFVFEELAWATGIGDRLEKVEGVPTVWYVLVNPGFAVSTAWVYQNLRLTSPGADITLPRFPRTAEGVVQLLHNDLERVTAVRYPQIEEVKGRLLEAGAAGALMSGSGPTVFGVFADEETARRAAESLSAEKGWRVFAVPPL